MTNSEDEDAATPRAIRPDPVASRDSAFFWAAAERDELVAQACAHCGKLHHPPRPMCPDCHSVERREQRLSGRGTVLSWTVQRHPKPVGFEEPPIIALIELEEGIRLVSNVYEIEAEGMSAGLAVEVFFASTRGGRAVPVFRPRQEPGADRR